MNHPVETIALNSNFIRKIDDCGNSSCRKVYGNHNKGRKFWCTQCTEFFLNWEKSKSVTKVKRKKEIRKKDPEFCQDCGKNFVSLKQHIKQMHKIQGISKY